MTSIPSLANPPNAPKTNRTRQPKPYKLQRIRSLVLPKSPILIPPPAPKKSKKKRHFNRDPIPLEWDVACSGIEAKWLAESGSVREKYLVNTPEDVAEEFDSDYLHRLWELYFPASQPRNAHEEAYLSLMRDCIDFRLSELQM